VERFQHAEPLRPSIVDPYLPFLRETLEQHPRLRATRLYRMIRDPYVREEQLLGELERNLKQLEIAPATLSWLATAVTESDKTETGAREQALKQLKAECGRFAFDGAVELEHGVDSNFPDSLRDGRLFGADNDFALVFVAAQLALDDNMSTFGKSGDELSK